MIPHQDFHLNVVTEVVDLLIDFFNWVQTKVQCISVLPLVSFQDYLLHAILWLGLLLAQRGMLHAIWLLRIPSLLVVVAHHTIVVDTQVVGGLELAVDNYTVVEGTQVVAGLVVV